MRVVAFDTETALVLPGLQAPPPACLSWAERIEGRIVTGLLPWHEAAKWLREKLLDPNVLLVGHHTPFDEVVMANHDPTLLPLLFAKHRAGHIHCTLLREMLRDLSDGMLGYRAQGHYTLNNLTPEELDKTTWRTGYGKLIGVPFGEWPEGAKNYALVDAKVTLELWERQGGLTRPVPDTEAQSRAGFVFYLMQTWGMRTDPVRVAEVEKELKERYMKLKRHLTDWRILREDGSQNMALTRGLVATNYPGGKAPRTKTGKVSTAAEVVNACDHAALAKLADYKHTEKLLSTFVPTIKKGVDGPICPRINTLVKNGRSSYRKPNLQQLPRKDPIRECFVPREGKIFVDADYDTLEVRTFAQVLKDLGHGHTLAKEYGKDPDFDPHCRLAAQIMGISYADAITRKKAGDSELKDIRQMSKAGNFGLAGGMGAQTFVDYAWKSYGVRIDIGKSKWLKGHWMRSIPETPKYFDMCQRMTRRDRATFVQLRSGRVRGQAGFTDLANGYWSGLAADGAKWAGFNMAEACYAKPDSVLYGSRPVVFIHDEFILEADEERGHEVGQELARIMQESMEDFTPDIPSRASPQLMRRWYKGAEPVYKNGRLVPWEPEEKAA